MAATRKDDFTQHSFFGGSGHDVLAFRFSAGCPPSDHWTASRSYSSWFLPWFFTVLRKGQVPVPVSGVRWISASAFAGCTGAGMGLAIRPDIPAEIKVAMAAVLGGVDAVCHGG